MADQFVILISSSVLLAVELCTPVPYQPLYVNHTVSSIAGALFVAIQAVSHDNTLNT